MHAFANLGVRIRGARNTLGLVRWTHPHLVSTPGRFKLKALMWSLLGRLPVCTFRDVVSDERIVKVPKLRRVKVKGCSCGEEGCRRRKGHEKWERTEVVTVHKPKREKFEHPLESIVPGHPRWELLLRYAAEDAVAALQIAELADAAEDPAPWPYEGERPGFNQAVEDEVVAMEAVGFHRDFEFCAAGAMKAEADEEKELTWLYRWYVVNGPGYGPHSRTQGLRGKAAKKGGVDSVWASPAKLIRLFDEVGFPRSPIWKKGRVKDGQVKLDGTALEWIGKNHPPAKQLVDHLIHLKRIRSGKKYLMKLRDAPDLVHIIAGPAGDEDDRAGAVTGRLGIKGPLEAQQLPSPENQVKDLYQVRRAIVARDGEVLVVADFSSLEIGVLGHLCKLLFGDDQIIQMYADQLRGIDMHSNNARNVFGRWLGWKVPKQYPVKGKLVPCEFAGQRVDAIPVERFKEHPYGKALRSMIKAVWYGLSYGKSAYGFSTLEGADGKMIGQELAEKMVGALLDAVPAMRKWFEWVSRFVRKWHGIYSPCGRWCDLADEMESGNEWQEKRAERRGYNFPCQAAGAGLIGDVMVRLGRCPLLKALGFRTCLQVHDEVVLRGPMENVEEAMELVGEHMRSATANGTELLLPLQVTVGKGFDYYSAK